MYHSTILTQTEYLRTVCNIEFGIFSREVKDLNSLRNRKELKLNRKKILSVALYRGWHPKLTTVSEGSKYCVFFWEEVLHDWQKSDVFLEDPRDQVLDKAQIKKHLSQDCML